MPALELLYESLNPELYPHEVAAAAQEVKCEFDLPVTYVKAIRNHHGAQETVHVFHHNELQLFPTRALRDGDTEAITAAARRLSLVYMQ